MSPRRTELILNIFYLSGCEKKYGREPRPEDYLMLPHTDDNATEAGEFPHMVSHRSHYAQITPATEAL